MFSPVDTKDAGAVEAAVQATYLDLFRDADATLVGRTADVLFEKTGRRPGQLIGRSPYLQPVQVMAPTSLLGEIAPVRITALGTNSLFGMLAQAPQLHDIVPLTASAGL